MPASPRARRWLGMRVWLSLAFILICAATAGATANLFLDRFERDFRDRAREIAAGSALDTAIRIAEADEQGRDVRVAVDEIGAYPTFVFDHNGALLTSARSQGTTFSAVPDGERALETALEGRRFIVTTGEAQTVIGLRVTSDNVGAIVVYARHPDVARGVGIARDTMLQAAIAAVVLGALVGSLAAWLIAARLRRIASGTAAIEEGNFEQPLVGGFPDEIGTLAATIDRMRERLRGSFATLASERDRLRRILERLAEGVITVDENLEVGFVNEAARRLLGERVREGAQLPDVWSSSSLRELASGLFSSEGASIVQRRIEENDRIYSVSGVPPDGLETAVLVVVDVSERERRERAEREFVANAAHELRTPLQTILGAVEALQSGAKDDAEEEERFLRHIEREATRLARLTRSLLVLARAQTREETPRLAPVALRAVIDDVLASVRPNEGVAVEADCPPDLAVLGDRDLLEQALLNLATNAAKHTDSGRIRIVACGDGNGLVTVDVCDSGGGIPAGEQERIFERFYRADGRSGDGFGLGLAIAREAVEAIGGRVDLESEPSGTTARITLARAAGGAA